MKNISSVLYLTVVFLLAMWNESSIAVTQKITGQASGSFVRTSIDIDGDGIPATTATFTVKVAPFGTLSAQNFSEVKLTSPAVACTTPNGGPGIESTLVDGSEVYRFDSTGDLLFTKMTSLAICFPSGPNDPSFSFTIEETFTGGTGKFANASGSNKINGTGVFVDPTGNLAGFTATSIGTITTK